MHNLVLAPCLGSLRRLLCHLQPAAWASRLISSVTICCTAVACATLPPPPLVDPTAAPTRVDSSGDDSTRSRVNRAATVAPALRLRPADVVNLQLMTATPVTYSGIVVDDTGAIFVPPVGEVEVAGMSIDGAAAAVTRAVRRLEPMAQAHMQLTSPSGQVATVLGAVNQPGSVSVFGGQRLSQVIANVGGLLTITLPGHSDPIRAADLPHAVMIRDGEPVQVDFERAIAGQQQDDIYVHPGDYLFLPMREQSTVTVLGQVGAPKVLPYWPGARLTQVVAAAGGVTVGGDKRDIRLVRGPPDVPVVYQADLQAVVDGEAPDVALQQDDVVFVTDHAFEDMGEVLRLVATLSGLVGTTMLLAAVL